MLKFWDGNKEEENFKHTAFDAKIYNTTHPAEKLHSYSTCDETNWEITGSDLISREGKRVGKDISLYIFELDKSSEVLSFHLHD